MLDGHTVHEYDMHNMIIKIIVYSGIPVTSMENTSTQTYLDDFKELLPMLSYII